MLIRGPVNRICWRGLVTPSRHSTERGSAGYSAYSAILMFDVIESEFDVFGPMFDVIVDEAKKYSPNTRK